MNSLYINNNLMSNQTKKGSFLQGARTQKRIEEETSFIVKLKVTYTLTTYFSRRAREEWLQGFMGVYQGGKGEL